MSVKLETLSNIYIKQDAGGYAGAYGAMKAMAEMMFAKLTPEDREHFEAVLDLLILHNTPKE